MDSSVWGVEDAKITGPILSIPDNYVGFQAADYPNMGSVEDRSPREPEHSEVREAGCICGVHADPPFTGYAPEGSGQP